MTRTTLLLLLFTPFLMQAQSDRSSERTFTLTSPDVGGQATMRQVFGGFGCTGENISPQLMWENAPEGTKSFAITMYDPDAPSGSGWWHWVVYDIPASTNTIPSGAGAKEGPSLPKGAKQGRTDFGEKAYGGPCPPEGDGPHRYIITIYALGTAVLEVPEDASPALIGFNLNGNSLGRASIMFYYER